MDMTPNLQNTLLKYKLNFLRPWKQEKDYLMIKKWNKDACVSNVGRQYGIQMMTLNKKCFDYKYLMHNFFKVFGIPNENNRLDQNEHIESKSKLM